MGHLCHVPLGETPTLALTLKAYFESVFIAREPCSEKALSLESMTGEVNGGELCVHRFEAQGVLGITVFVFSKRWASGVRKKEKGW